jgi:hypothetical protein
MTDRSNERPARSGLVAAVLGAVFPGLGHGYIGRWWRAAAMVVPTIGLIALVVVVARTPRFELLGVLVSPAVLRGILVANLFIVVWRVAGVADPYRLARGHTSAWTTATVLLLGFLVALPHVVIARYTLDAAAALDQVFVTGEPVPLVSLEESFDSGAVPDSGAVILPIPDPAPTMTGSIASPSSWSAVTAARVAAVAARTPSWSRRSTQRRGNQRCSAFRGT